MPRAKSAKSTKSSRSKTVPQPALTKAYESEMSYETRVIIVILLLLFVYPLGLICMWAWMRDWPLWLKFVISIPFFLGVLAFFAGVILLGTVIGSAGRSYRMQETQQRTQVRQDFRLPTGNSSNSTY